MARRGRRFHVPLPRDAAEAEAHLHAAVLAAPLSEGEADQGEPTTRAALAVLKTLDRETCKAHLSILRDAVDEAARRELEDLKRTQRRPLEWPEPFEQLVDEGLSRGLSQGRVEALLDLLDSRGPTPSAEPRATIQACTDEVALRRWLRRAATAVELTRVLESRAGRRIALSRRA